MLTAIGAQYISNFMLHRYLITLNTEKLFFTRCHSSTEETLLNSSNNKRNASTTENTKKKLCIIFLRDKTKYKS